MADFSATIRQLQMQRQELLEQVAAVDKALAALVALDRGVRPTGGSNPRTAPARKRRILSEEHKQKMIEGRRRSREAAQAAADSGSAPGLPRLVRHPVTAPPATTPES